MKKNMVLPFLAFILTLCASVLQAQRITVNGNRFNVYGKEIWLNGANTPWHNWNDFGTGNYNSSWWDTHMQTLNDNGINCIRVWISCNGGGGIKINPDGTVTGVTASFFDDLDDFFDLAESHEIYIMATMLSFDHVKSGNPNYQAFRNCWNDTAKAGTLVDNYVVPFVERYKDNPYLFAVDACNEIEWAHENAESGNISWNRLQFLVARMAAGVHQTGPVLFTMGSAAIKWNSDVKSYGAEANEWKNSALRAQCDSPDAFLDFYSPHWYGWCVRWFGNPCVVSPTGYGINDRPCVIGECPAKGMFNQNAQGTDVLVNDPVDMYEKAFQKGWSGVFPWTSNGGADGSIADFGVGTQTFADNHQDLVFPSGTKVNDALRIRPETLRLSGYPNPFNGETTILYHLQRPALVELQILDVRGCPRRLLVQSPQSAGDHASKWDGRGDFGNPLPSGVYFCRLNTADEQRISKLLMVK